MRPIGGMVLTRLENPVLRMCYLIGVGLLVALATALPAADITIKAISGLQYDVKRFAVEPGAKVSIHFVNDDATDMPHNLVFTKPGKRMDVVNAAMAMGADAIKTGFVPPGPDVIAAIPEVKPHAEAKLTFTAPKVLRRAITSAEALPPRAGVKVSCDMKTVWLAMA